jgi:hypothetical protein
MSRNPEIPARYYSDETSQPFDSCLVCGRYLLDAGVSYLIEKSYRNTSLRQNEVLFEYAICMECAMKFHEALSTETRERIQQYLLQSGLSVNMRKNEEEMVAAPTHCQIKNTPLESSAEFQVVVHCQGRSLVSDVPPFAVGTEAMDEMAALFSPKSRDEMDGFIGQYFTGPPEVAEILRRRPVMV